MKQYRINPGSSIKLGDWDAGETSAFTGDKKVAENRLLKLNLELGALQEVLFAEHAQRILVVLQAMDTGGKDGTIRHVFEGVNPQGVRVASFKVPTPIELDHDYLWRIHSQMPSKGEIVIFNRSHYEDVLVVRVHNLVPETVWMKRYEQINHFEKMLSDEGTTILKLFLHIDKAEQKQRLSDRLNDPTKQWKFNPGDLKERDLWEDYMTAYEEMLNRTSTDYAPWYLIPANHKWYRNLVIAETLVETLKNLKMNYPKPGYDPKTIVIA